MIMARLTAVQTTHLEEFPTIEHRVSIAKSVVSKANISSNQICAVLSTGIDVYTQPSDSIAIASGIGTTHALSASINNSCASVSAAFDIAMHQINGQPDKVVIVTSSSIFNEIHRDNNWTDSANGVGVAIIRNGGYGLKIIKIKHESNAKYFGLKTIELMSGQVFKLRINEKKGSPIWNEYRKAAVDFPVSVLKDALLEIGWAISDINHWVFHRSELTAQWCSALGIDARECTQNMGALTTLIQLDDLLKNGRITARDRIAVLEIGLGMSASIMLLENGDEPWGG